MLKVCIFPKDLTCFCHLCFFLLVLLIIPVVLSMDTQGQNAAGTLALPSGENNNNNNNLHILDCDGSIVEGKDFRTLSRINQK